MEYLKIYLTHINRIMRLAICANKYAINIPQVYITIITINDNYQIINDIYIG